jgi:hypothetical protein
MTAPAPANQPPKKRRARSRNLAAAGDVFGDFTPRRNPVAVRSYVTALYGLTPLLGLVLGLVAIALGVIGLKRQRLNPDVGGANFATAGIVIGTIDLIFNTAGIACLTRGLGWW